MAVPPPALLSRDFYQRRASLYPPYQVAGRDMLNSSAWGHEAHYRLEPGVVPGRPLQQSYDSSQADRQLCINATRERTPPAAVHSSTPLPPHETEGDNAELSLPPGQKRQRYLREADRRNIIQRIDNGEKQAELAREFGVTRAAICHIKKKRHEIVSRYETLLAAAKEFVEASMPRVSSSVHELTQPTVQLLLTTLRDVTTPPRTFRASANRLMMLLLEEALAGAATVSATVHTTAGQTVRGLKSVARDVCSVGAGDKGGPLINLYRHQIEPHGRVGGLKIVTTEENGPVVERLDLPHDLPADARTLLLSVSSASGESLCVSVAALQQCGVALDNILVVVLVATVDAVARVTHQFPGIRILTCAIERLAPRAPKATTLSDFLDRYDPIQHVP